MSVVKLFKWLTICRSNLYKKKLAVTKGMLVSCIKSMYIKVTPVSRTPTLLYNVIGNQRDFWKRFITLIRGAMSLNQL